MSRSFLRISALILPLFLTACGDGWEAQKTTKYKPYGNSRTAGSGIVYVRAKLLPKKELKLEPEIKETPPAQEKVKAAPPAPVKPADKMFNDAQIKGHSVKATKETKEEHSSTQGLEAHEDHAMLTEEETILKQKEAAWSNRVALKDRAGEVSTSIPELKNEKNAMSSHSELASDPNNSVKKSDSHGLEVPKHIYENHVIDGSDVKTEFMPSAITPEAGDVLDDVVIIEEHMQSMTEQSFKQPIKEIIAPKTDRASILSVGQETLDAIYNSPF